MYEYGDFIPIPFQAGDILGMWIPQTTRLNPFIEPNSGPTSFFWPADNTGMILDLQNTSKVVLDGYPLVSVEIGK